LNWITIIWPMAIAACVTLAAIHAQIGARMIGRDRLAHVYFTISALAVAATGFFELLLLQTRDHGQFQRLMLYAQAPIWLMQVSLAGFTWHFLERGWLRVGRWSVAVVTLALACNFVVEPSHRIRFAAGISPDETLWRARFTLPRMEYGPLAVIETISVIMLVAFVLRCALLTWRAGKHRRAVLVGGGIVFFLLVSRTYAALVEAGLLHTPFFFIFPFLGLLLAMGRELSLEVFRAARLAEALRESERRMELAARAATMGFWVWDLQRDDLWATNSARILFGASSTEPLDFARFMDYVAPECRDPVQRAVDHSLASGEDYEMEYQSLSPSGVRRWISAQGKVDLDEKGAPRLMRGVVIDITERKTAQMEMDAMRRELAHLTRVSTMGELAGSLAHELNQPLAAILSNAQAARRFLAAPVPDLDLLREILEDIIKDDKRAGEVIHRLRAMVQRRGLAGVEAVNLNELVRDAERLLHGELIARQVTLQLMLHPDLPVVAAGRVELQQVLINLLVNAMDAMRDLPVDSRVITVETGADGKELHLAVRDAGPGVPDELLPEIFRPFFTTKTHGLGMGLAISRSLVEAHGGKLTLRNPPGGGACFTITLPLGAADAGAPDRPLVP
jgi:two-component system sensor kinase FixL